MLLQSTTISRSDFEHGTGWQLRPEGACKGDVCIALPEALQGDLIDVESLAEVMGLPLVAAQDFGLWSLGPESIGARALTSALAGELELPDLEGNAFKLSSLRGQKVLVYAWAPY